MHLFWDTGKWGVAKTVRFGIENTADTTMADSGDWTPATGDVKFVKGGVDGGNTTNLPTYIANGVWQLTLTATEMSATELAVTIVDAAVKDTLIMVNTTIASQNASSYVGGIAGTKNDLDDLNDLTAAQVNTEADTALTDYDGPTDTEMIARTKLTADYADKTTIDAIKVTTDTFAFTGNDVKATLDSETVTVGTNNDKTGYALTAAGIDSILDEAIVEPTAIFTWPTTLRIIVGYMGALSRNKITQTATTTLLRDDADAATISTITVSDDGTTYISGEAV